MVALLAEKNGLYAFHDALHVLPSGCAGAPMDLERWNAETLWRGQYGQLTRNCLFFAEDVLGVQFGIREGAVYKFDPETGDLGKFAESIESWAGRILDDGEFQTGFPLLLKWEELNGPLAKGKRLLPKIPFVLGGEYSAANLYAGDAVEGMKARADMWHQLKSLPDGTHVRLRIIHSQ